MDPDRQTIDDPEHTVKLPAGAKSLRQYSRYYAGTMSNATQGILAIYLLSRPVNSA